MKIELILVIALFAQCLGQMPQPNPDLSCSISGTVLNEDGHPILSQLVVYQLVIRYGLERAIPKCSVRSNSDGYYSCRNIEPGRYIVKASTVPAEQPSNDKTSPKPRKSYPFKFYRNATALDDATVIQVHHEEDARSDFIFNPGHTRTVSGLVSSEPSIIKLDLTLHSEEYEIGSGLPVTYDQRTGRFVVEDVPDGQYQLIGTWFSDGKDHHGSIMFSTGQPLATELRLQEDVNTKVEGIINVGTGLSKALPSTISLEKQGDADSKRYMTKIEANGSFSFPSVPSGDYCLALQEGFNAYIRAVSNQGKDLPKQHFVISGESPVVFLSVELSQQTASISGTVERSNSNDGRPSVVLQSLNSGQITTVITDTNRRFSVTGLSPGEYRLLAWSKLDDVPYRSPRFLARYVRDSTTVFVDESSPVTQIDVPLVE
jgi:hypothetical protein